MKKRLTFIQFSSSQTKNYIGEVIEVTAGPISDTIKTCMELSLTIGELAKDTGASFRVFVKKYSQERKYISKSINMPFLINTSLTYMTQVYYNISPIDESINQLKKSFSPLILFPLPPVNSTDYAKMMKVSKVSELNELLGRFSEK